MNLAVVSLASFPRRQPHQRFSRRSQNQPADQRTVKITDTTPRDAALRSRNVSLRGLVAEPVAAGRGDLVKSRVKGVMAKMWCRSRERESTRPSLLSFGSCT